MPQARMLTTKTHDSTSHCCRGGQFQVAHSTPYVFYRALKQAKGQMLRNLISYPKYIFRLIRPVLDKVDLKKSHNEIFSLNFFAIHSSSRHEKRCQMLERIFCLFQYSKNIRLAMLQVVPDKQPTPMTLAAKTEENTVLKLN